MIESIRMKTIRSGAALALVISLAAATGFAQTSGEDIFKSKCAMCHGPAGIPNPAMAKALGVPAVTDAAVKAMTIPQIEHQVVTGKGNMKPITGLTDAQVKAVATYFKSLTK
jgi:mono/diheme cytochrome c family protein